MLFLFQHLETEMYRLNQESVMMSGLRDALNPPATFQGTVFDYDYAISVGGQSVMQAVKCDKETNTDASNSQVLSDQLSRQSHDMNHGSTIRRWQTFSPTAAGVTEEELGCKVRHATLLYMNNDKSNILGAICLRVHVCLAHMCVCICNYNHRL